MPQQASRMLFGTRVCLITALCVMAQSAQSNQQQQYSALIHSTVSTAIPRANRSVGLRTERMTVGTSAAAGWFRIAIEGGGLQQPARCHGSHGATNDQMIEYSDIDQLQCRFQAPGNPFVCLRGFTDFGGVIVSEDHGRGIQGQRLFDHFPRIYRTAIDGTSKHFPVSDDFMAVVQKVDTEDLVFGITERCLQVGFGITGTVDGVAIIEALQYALPGALDELVSLDGAVGSLCVPDAKGIGGGGRFHFYGRGQTQHERGSFQITAVRWAIRHCRSYETPHGAHDK